MNLKRFLKQFVTDPNSSEGLRMRAEVMREAGDKEQDPQQKEKSYLYAEVLVAVAENNWPVWKNKEFIRENLRPK